MIAMQEALEVLWQEFDPFAFGAPPQPEALGGDGAHMTPYRVTADNDLDNLRIVLSDSEIATYMELFPLTRAEVIATIVRFGPSRPAVEAALHARVSGIEPLTARDPLRPSAASEQRASSIRFEDWQSRIQMSTDIDHLVRLVRAYLAAWKAEELAQLPLELGALPLPNSEAIAARAVIASRAEVKFSGPEAEHRLLRDMALTLSVAASRLRFLKFFGNRV